MAALLTAFMKEVGDLPLDWSGHAGTNCTFWVADWIKLRTGYDPAASWRNKLQSVSDVRRALLRAGSLLALVAPPMDARFARTDDYADGDAGLVQPPRCDEIRIAPAVAGVFSHGLWHIRTARGFGGGKWPVVTAWSIQ